VLNHLLRRKDQAGKDETISKKKERNAGRAAASMGAKRPTFVDMDLRYFLQMKIGGEDGKSPFGMIVQV